MHWPFAQTPDSKEFDENIEDIPLLDTWKEMEVCINNFFFFFFLFLFICLNIYLYIFKYLFIYSFIYFHLYT